MKRFIHLLIVAAIATSALAQSATLNVSETAASKLIVKTFCVDDPAQSAWVIVQYQDSSNNVKREAAFPIPANPSTPGTEYSDFLSALGTAAANETGSVRRRANFRILTYLVTTYPRISGVTLVP